MLYNFFFNIFPTLTLIDIVAGGQQTVRPSVHRNNDLFDIIVQMPERGT